MTSQQAIHINTIHYATKHARPRRHRNRNSVQPIKVKAIGNNTLVENLQDLKVICHKTFDHIQDEAPFTRLEPYRCATSTSASTDGPMEVCGTVTLEQCMIARAQQVDNPSIIVVDDLANNDCLVGRDLMQSVPALKQHMKELRSTVHETTQQVEHEYAQLAVEAQVADRAWSEHRARDPTPPTCEGNHSTQPNLSTIADESSQGSSPSNNDTDSKSEKREEEPPQQEVSIPATDTAREQQDDSEQEPTILTKSEPSDKNDSVLDNPNTNTRSDEDIEKVIIANVNIKELSEAEHEHASAETRDSTAMQEKITSEHSHEATIGYRACAKFNCREFCRGGYPDNARIAINQAREEIATQSKSRSSNKAMIIRKSPSKSQTATKQQSTNTQRRSRTTSNDKLQPAAQQKSNSATWHCKNIPIVKTTTLYSTNNFATLERASRQHVDE